MNSTSTTRFMEAVASLYQQGGPRALIVSLDRSGHVKSDQVKLGQSVLNIQNELIDHLDSEPFDAAWLENLRDYCTARMAARQGKQRPLVDCQSTGAMRSALSMRICFNR